MPSFRHRAEFAKQLRHDHARCSGGYTREDNYLHTHMTTTENSTLYEQMTWPMLVERANGQWGAIFEDLAPTLLSEAVANAPFHVGCPVHGGTNGYRLFEHFNKTGRGICNSCGPQRTGFETLAWAKRKLFANYGFEDAVREVAQWVRKEAVQPPRPPRAAPPAYPKMDPAIAYLKIREVWKASTELRGTAAERYLASRGIPADTMPRTLRAHPGLRYYDMKTKTFYGEFPALLAPIRNKDGKLVSIHRIYLTPDGLKAPVPEVKKMMSPCAEIVGASVRLYEPGPVLGVAEGIETALAARVISRLPVWAGVAAVLMERLDLPDTVEHVVIWADLDRSNRGVEAADMLADRVEATGRSAEVCIPQGPIPENAKGVDWLDVLRTKGMSGFPARWRRWRPAEA